MFVWSKNRISIFGNSLRLLWANYELIRDNNSATLYHDNIKFKNIGLTAVNY